ncbi:phage major capsid protein [Sphingobacterium sp. UT-1RO-CII-1]|uniref:phage major capsid protein n=1 Tax=Sphingobacterium sp. UT-1RO-CII-1 TaxID=2995225 RepID=UPI00227B8E74|nr:phage major capsid protein [Sphingobacterium sp. UT-1RO-CII-1]MCY4781703.1 phage major capsid protein [Sphingobacterium sp. UT-1RO-CII-1]
MSTIDIKEIRDAVEDGIQVLKKDWSSAREADQKSFDDKVENVLTEVKELSKVKDNVDKLQKDLNTAIVEMKESNSSNQPKHKSFSQALADSLKDGHAGLLKSLETNGQGQIEIKGFDYPNFNGYEGFVTETRQQMYGLKDDPFHWRQIIPLGSTSKQIIEYPKEVEDIGAPEPWEDVSPRKSKEDFTPGITMASNKIEWIAGIIKEIPLSMLEDLPWLTSFLNRRAYRALLRAEDKQLLSGNGTSPQLSGLLMNSVAYDGTEYDLFLEQIIDAAERQIADNENDANHIVMSNADKVGIILNKALGSGDYNLPAGAIGYVNGQLNLSGLALHSTRQFNKGQALVGDFRETEFIIRSAPVLKWFDQNKDDAEKNQLMLRIEERGGLAVYDEKALVKIGFN